MKKKIVSASLLLALTVACSENKSEQSSASPKVSSGAIVSQAEELQAIQKINSDAKYSLTRQELDELLANKAIEQAEYNELLKLTKN